jgi:hypothetical protein
VTVRRMPKRANTDNEITEMLELYKSAAERLDGRQEGRPRGRVAERLRDRLVRKGTGGSGTRRPRNNNGRPRGGP